MPTPVFENGNLRAAGGALYRVPNGKYAVIISLVLVNTSGVARSVLGELVSPGSGRSTFLDDNLTAAGAAGYDWSLDSERWVLTEGTSIEMTGDDSVSYHISGLEYSL